MQSQKWQNDLCSFPRQTIQYHSNPSLGPNHKCWRSCSWTVLWRPTRPSRTNIPKRCAIHYRELEWKSRKSRDTWVTGKFGLGVQNEAGRRLTEFCQENALVIANTLFQQTTQKMSLHVDITKWSILKSYWLYSLQLKMEKPYTISKNKTWSWLWLRSWALYCNNFS